MIDRHIEMTPCVDWLDVDGAHDFFPFIFRVWGITEIRDVRADI